MEQPQAEWWRTFISWVATNTVAFLIVGVVWRFIDKMFAFFTKLIDGRLMKITDTVVDKKMAPLNTKIDEMSKQIQYLTDLIIKGK
jgi:hypothetical protein